MKNGKLNVILYIGLIKSVSVNNRVSKALAPFAKSKGWIVGQPISDIFPGNSGFEDAFFSSDALCALYGGVFIHEALHGHMTSKGVPSSPGTCGEYAVAYSSAVLICEKADLYASCAINPDQQDCPPLEDQETPQEYTMRLNEMVTGFCGAYHNEMGNLNKNLEDVKTCFCTGGGTFSNPCPEIIKLPDMGPNCDDPIHGGCTSCPPL